ncbi:hypothetical protein BHE74_00051395, partial [Ensete ventricosum]
SIFCAPSRNFKILAICNVLAHRKSYEHGFVKKCDSHKLYTKLRVESSFDRFFVHRLRISKYWPFPTISLWEVIQEWFREKMRRSYSLHKVECEII